MYRPAALCLLAAVLWSVESQGKPGCCGEWVCELRDPNMDRTCYTRSVIKNSLPPLTAPLTRQPHLIPRVDGQTGDWGAMIYPAIDLSHLNSRFLREQGINATDLDVIEPFLHRKVVGRVAKKVLAESLRTGNRQLSEEGYTLLQAIAFKLKQDKVEAFYNTAVNKLGRGVCFVNTTQARKSVLMALMWPVRDLRRSHPGFTLAANNLWDGVVNMFRTSGDGLFRTVLPAQKAIQDDEQLVDCPYVKKPVSYRTEV